MGLHPLVVIFLWHAVFSGKTAISLVCSSSYNEIVTREVWNPILYFVVKQIDIIHSGYNIGLCLVAYKQIVTNREREYGEQEGRQICKIRGKNVGFNF